MGVVKRLLAVCLAALLAFLSVASEARAAGNSEAAARAAAFIASKVGEGDHLKNDFGTESITADAVLALASVKDPRYTAAIDRMVGYLAKRAPAYAAKSPEGAAKLALVAVTTGRKATDFGGVDLLGKIRAGTKPDGSFGAYPGPYAQSTGIIALIRSGEEVPATMVNWLVAQQDPNTGGFGYAKGQAPDADNTGLALLALTGVEGAPTAPAGVARQKALDWMVKNRAPDGSWTGFVPANSTAVATMGLQAAGSDTGKSISWLVAQQQADGSFHNKGQPDLLATAQCVLPLAGATYLDVPPAGDTQLPWMIAGAAALIVVAVAGLLIRRRRAAKA